MRQGLPRLTAGARPALALAVALGLVGALATIAQMALLSRIIAVAVQQRPPLAAFRAPLLLLVGASLVRAAALGLQEMSGQGAAAGAKAALRERLLAHLVRLGPAYTRAERTGELAAAAGEGVERLDAYVGRYLPQRVLSVLVPLLIFLAVLPRDRLSAAILFLTAPVIPLLMALVGSETKEHAARQWTALARLSAYLLDAIQGLPTLALFGRARAEEARLARVSDRYRERTLQVLRRAFLSGLVLELMTGVAIALVAVALAVRLLGGGVSFEAALFVLLLTPEFYRPLRELGAQRHAAMEGEAALERIGAILAVPAPTHGEPAAPGAGASHQTTGAAAPTEPRRPRSLSIWSGTAERSAGPAVAALGTPYWPGRSGRGGAPASDGAARGPRTLAGPLTIRFADVAYAYPGQDAPALAGVTLTLPPGARTALVGPSGAGKSTLVALLLRLLDPTRGQIAANGVPLAALAPERWRELVAYVPQRPHLFAGTIAENIALARAGATRSDIEAAAELAGVLAFARRLAGGLAADAGEGGNRLSQGEAQRVALARAFLKDAPLLVLDEPTSSLDPASEALVRAALARLVAGRTTLIVAHRLNTVRDAEQVAVLERGRLVELGRHADLAARGGLYARLVGASEAVPA